MFDLIIVPATVVGFVTSWVVELLKLFPGLGNSARGKRILAIIVSILATALYVVYSGVNYHQWASFALLVLASSFLTYQTIVKTILKE